MKFATYAGAVIAFLVTVSPTPAKADAVLDGVIAQYKFFVTIEPDDNNPKRFVYADSDHIHIYAIDDKGEYVQDWETTNLGARASAVFITDLEADGSTEIVIATSNGRILIYAADGYDLLWENLQDRFERIEAMTAADIDRDPQQELIIVAGEILYIYDGSSKAVEWQSIRHYKVDEIILGNVDDDEQLEIIFNTGFVIDSRFFSVEYESESSFGSRIRLLDLNNDDIPEIIGETPDFTLRVFDVYAQRELW
jgi:hypothetical protein